MSLRLEQLQVARLAVPVLGESAGLVTRFLLSTQCPEGGFADRDGNEDLYYTVFAMDCLNALQAELPEKQLHPYLRSYNPEAGLDFVHLCCLARCWSAMKSLVISSQRKAALLAAIETFRTGDGGYHPSRDSAVGTTYGCFLAYGAYSDLGAFPPFPEGLAACLDSLRTPDGAWANDARMTVGSTAATAAAVAVSRNLHHPIDAERTGAWLLAQAHPAGGFVAAPGSPLPDLLSTAVALHALDSIQVSFEPLREIELDFVDSLWSAEGGFHGNWTDNVLDCEYTFYGLLALGHLGL